MISVITTLTLNPSIDLAGEAEAVRPWRKTRMRRNRQEPGGGGVHVARMICELGGHACAMVLAGGITGRVLEQLLDEAAVPRRVIPILGDTRISQTVRDQASGQEYRFIPEGPVVREAEWRAVLAALEELAEGSWLVASGSLPRGVPEDFYARLADLARRRRLRLALDTSGPALRACLGQGVTLLKPSLVELEALLGRELPDATAQETAAQALVRDGGARLVAVTLGRGGALLASAAGTLRLPAVGGTAGAGAGIEAGARTEAGAGDSFLAAMTLSLVLGRRLPDAFAWGMAAGAAAAATQGTTPPRRAEVARLRREITTVPMAEAVA